MEAATAAAPASAADPKPETAIAGSDPVDKTPSKLFRYSTWIHVGPGAEECEGIDEEARKNECTNPLHFHAWCRLPNQFQHREIREKAQAAQARRARQLRDPESDSYAVLEDDLDRLRRGGDEVKSVIVDELTGKDWWADTLEAAQDLLEEEADDGTKPWEHIEQDQIRLRELRALPEEERPSEELGELEKHVSEYEDKLEAGRDARMKPKKEALMALPFEELVEQMRNDRIERLSHDEFMNVYSKWEWYVGTLVAPGGAGGLGEQRFGSVKEMEAAAPEVLLELHTAFNDLERTKNRDDSGNS